MKKKNTIPSDFENLLGSIGYSNPEEGGGVTVIEDEPFVPLVEDEDKTNEPPVNNNPEDGKNSGSDDPNAHEDNTDIPPVIDNPEPPVNEPPVEEPVDDPEPTDADVIEAQQVGLLFDAIGNSLGWNMDEIDEKDRPLTVDDLTQYFTDVVNQNSKPEYADERIQALDEYVKNGGKFEDFYSRQQEALTLDNIDLEDENNQKAVVREFMQRAGYSDEQINKKITRYEDSDVLYDEAEDALGRLKEIRQQEADQLKAQQEAYAKQQAEESRQFFTTVTKDINELTNIRGINVPKEDRKALFDYIFKVDQNGQSQYTKDFNKNLSKNLIESAYFTMKGDSLVSTAKKDGESSAADKLRKMLRHSAKNHSTYNVEDKQKSVTDLVNGLF
jgi:negative regulator of replication initiation